MAGKDNKISIQLDRKYLESWEEEFDWVSRDPSKFEGHDTCLCKINFNDQKERLVMNI